MPNTSTYHDMSMTGKSVIVTGAANGMGRVAAILVARAGGRLIIADIDEINGEATRKAITDEGGEAYFVQTDVASEDSIQRMVAEAVRRFGRLDGAFNNAAISQCGKALHELSTAEWSRCIDVNLSSVFWCMKHEILAMLENGGGSIVNSASTAAITGVARTAEYSAAKGGVTAITRSAAIEYGRSNIRVNCILPGPVKTATFFSALSADLALAQRLETSSVLGRFGEPEEVGAAALWLLSGASSYVTGIWMPVDGGSTAAN